MPSFEHEILVQLVRQHPEVVLELVGAALGIEAGAVEVVADSENLTAIAPIEFRADSVLLVRPSAHSRVHAAFVVEVQLDTDPDKRFSWPAYLAIARARFRCPVSLVVLTTSARVARWSAQAIALDHVGSVFRAHVLGPDGVPVLAPDAADRHPELAVLSLLAHRDDPAALSLGRAILAACGRLDDERAALYTDVVFSFLNRAARAALEAEMHLEKYEFRSEFMRNLQAKAIAEGLAQGLEQGRALGIEQGRAQGIEQGRAQGIEQGRAEAYAVVVRTLLGLLEGRGFEVSEARRASIAACTDLAQLETWLARAATAGSIDAVFAGT